MHLTESFGRPVHSDEVEKLFDQLNTMARPSLSSGEKSRFHDWVLVRRKGLELGFVDSAYQRAQPRVMWGSGTLLLVQANFYAGNGDVERYQGEMPFGITWTDCRPQVLAKLATYAGTHRASGTDTWDVPGYRLTVFYAGQDERATHVLCRQLPQPIPRAADINWPKLKDIAAAFGTPIIDPDFKKLWGDHLNNDKRKGVEQKDEIDLLTTFGSKLFVAASHKGPVFQAITLHRNRDDEAAGWGGELPLGLDFEDSPRMLFRKIRAKPVKQIDFDNTSRAVWHLEDYTLHVHYSRVDNRLMRIQMTAPGVLGNA